MRVQFYIRFSSVWGQQLYLSFHNGDVLPMQYHDEQYWQVSADMEAGECSYRYILNGLPEKETRTIRIEPNDSELTVTDVWISPSAPETIWLTAPFTQVFFKHATADDIPARSCTFKVRAPLLPPDECVYLTGNTEALGNWDTQKAIRMSFADDVFFTATVDIPEHTRLEYKYLHERIYEEGGNRQIYIHPGRTIIRDDFTRFNKGAWKGAGVAVPVFSLRSEQGFGTGEFADIRQLADWAASTGQRILQLLPVNDTIIDYSWKDSYPYAAISAYALHPLYIHLPAVGALPESYDAQQAELNKTMQLDYETVIRLKMHYLQILFQDFKPGAAFDAWVATQEHWLKPYAAFCLQRDEGQRQETFYYFIQYHLHLQLSDAVAYAHAKGIAIKGDLPIGVYRYGVDAITSPELFNMRVQAGAPPDDFAEKGQNWGFPTYNWQQMEATGYTWWTKRLQHMAQYFSAYRIDHILGLFRIWQIPLEEQEGIAGYFEPSIPFTEEELRQWGIPFDRQRYCHPFTVDDHADVLFFEPVPDAFHPRFGMQFTRSFQALEPGVRERLLLLCDHFFYHRHNELWEQEAMRKLPVLQQATDMLVCGEDLGMVPHCVPGVMQQLGILSLEIARMPKRRGQTLADIPYLSVTSASTHDMSTLREWWKGDPSVVIRQHLSSPAMLCIFQLQDWLALDNSLPHLPPQEERINNPAVTPWYWRYRMPLTLEALKDAEELQKKIRRLISESGR